MPSLQGRAGLGGSEGRCVGSPTDCWTDLPSVPTPHTLARRGPAQHVPGLPAHPWPAGLRGLSGEEGLEGKCQVGHDAGAGPHGHRPMSPPSGPVLLTLHPEEPASPCLWRCLTRADGSRRPRAQPCSWGRGQGAMWVGPTAFPGQDPVAYPSPGPPTSDLFYLARPSPRLTLLLCFPNPPRLEISLPNRRNDAQPASWASPRCVYQEIRGHGEAHWVFGCPGK